MLPARLRQRLSRGTPPREELVAEHVVGRTFLDVGCMWRIHGGIALAAEAAGATAVTGVDVMEASPEYLAERERRGSSMRFVRGDVHDPALVDEVGPHDVVWCSGVLYHAPHPLLTLERLRALTGRTLILATETIPRRGTVCEFAPEPGVHPGIDRRLDPAEGYVGWYWGISPGAVRRMLEVSGFELQDEHRTAFHMTVVARPR